MRRDPALACNVFPAGRGFVACGVIQRSRATFPRRPGVSSHAASSCARVQRFPRRRERFVPLGRASVVDGNKVPAHAICPPRDRLELPAQKPPQDPPDRGVTRSKLDRMSRSRYRDQSTVGCLGRLRSGPRQRRRQIAFAREEQHRHGRKVARRIARRHGRGLRRRPLQAPCTIPLPPAVARSHGNSCAGDSRATARSMIARRCEGLADGSHGGASSTHRLLSCSPWLSAPAGAASPRRTAARNRSSACV